MDLHIDIISDVICPWCYIGKRRLEKAIAAYTGLVTVRWHAFQLNPMMPKEGMSRRDYRIKKFGTRERSLALDAEVIVAGRAEGLQFAIDKIERTPNTVDAHRLIWLADNVGIQDAIMEALFRAYFTEGRDISNARTLLNVVIDAGLDRSMATALLKSDEGLDAIRESSEVGERFHVSGVPFFIFNGTFTLSGAQPPAAFLRAFQRVVDESQSTSS